MVRALVVVMLLGSGCWLEEDDDPGPLFPQGWRLPKDAAAPDALPDAGSDVQGVRQPDTR